ncbi:hypothetical protein DLAC_05458 [Tieghemostelium lacteum]|uniref:EGF-like domain-containing protein n=1 Tax=Tieghemostelium lacteum TaxID=361077 RepID=A0A151ZG73_TIELA|nr:hypothetical protein DLAC_05458 [Tieghemostelium lacteum]|eukprot:KYQ92870.1 hypothetical protein DLAC_05458 [Tieghemostelium lacteum]
MKHFYVFICFLILYICGNLNLVESAALVFTSDKVYSSGACEPIMYLWLNQTSTVPDMPDGTLVLSNVNTGNYVFRFSVPFSPGNTQQNIIYEANGTVYQKSVTYDCKDVPSNLTLLSKTPQYFGDNIFLYYFQTQINRPLPVDLITPIMEGIEGEIGKIVDGIMQVEFRYEFDDNTPLEYTKALSMSWYGGFSNLQFSTNALFSFKYCSYSNVNFLPLSSPSPNAYSQVFLNSNTSDCIFSVASNAVSSLMTPILYDGTKYTYRASNRFVGTQFNTGGFRLSNEYPVTTFDNIGNYNTPYQDPMSIQIVTSTVVAVRFGSVVNLKFTAVFINDTQVVSFSQNIGNIYYHQPFPFGAVQNLGTSLNFNFDVIYSKFSKNVSGVVGNQGPFGPLDLSPTSSDILPPTLLKVTFEYIGEDAFLLRINAKDNISGIKKIFMKSQGGDYTDSLDGLNLAVGNIQNGQWEKVLHFKYLYVPGEILKWEIVDFAGNNVVYKSGDLISIPVISFQDAIIPFNPLYSMITIPKITGVSFQTSNLNLDQSLQNTLYLKVSNGSPHFLPTLIITPSYQLVDVNVFLTFNSTYNQAQSQYEFSITFPPNLSSTLNYGIVMPTSIILSQQLVAQYGNSAKMQVTASRIDQMPPMVKVLVPFQFINSTTCYVGLNITIDDMVNGFMNGEILLTSQKNRIGLFKNFNQSDLIGGDITSGTYEVLFYIDIDECTQQTFTIAYMKLTDRGGHFSSTQSKGYLDSTLIDPLMFIDVSLTTFTLVNPSIADNSLPVFNGFTPSSWPSQLNVALISRFILEFRCTDNFGLSRTYLPKVYLTQIGYETLVFDSYIYQETTRGDFIYHVNITIPEGFGFNSPIYVSVYGIYDTNLNLFGVQSSNIAANPIQTIYSPTPLLEKASKITNSGGQLTLYGQKFTYFEPIPKVLCSYIDQLANLEIQYLSDSILIVNVKATISPYTIQLSYLNGTVQSNNLTVTPVYVPPPTVPIVCKGSPQCGGPTNGECTSNGCVCIPPWIGLDCSSQQIPVPLPTVDPTAPSTEGEYELPGSGGETTTLRSLVSIVALKELTFKNEPVATYNFTEWLFTNISTNATIEYLYSTKIDNYTQINVTVTWFTKETDIEFANQVIHMLPSTIKYRVDISPYHFNSTLNTLQLVMSASITTSTSESDACSLKEYDEDNDYQYVKLQVDSNSLYGRFIKRADIDNNYATISNTLLDSSFKEITNQTQTSQTYIGINIPHFYNYVIIDPDFSVLVDSRPADEKDGAFCQISSNEKGLSKTQLVGIIIGAGVLGIAAMAGILYYIIKVRKSSKEMKKLNTRLKKMGNQD